MRRLPGARERGGVGAGRGVARGAHGDGGQVGGLEQSRLDGVCGVGGRQVGVCGGRGGWDGEGDVVAGCAAYGGVCAYDAALELGGGGLE